jgi:hypothetical protein
MKKSLLLALMAIMFNTLVAMFMTTVVNQVFLTEYSMVLPCLILNILSLRWGQQNVIQSAILSGLLKEVWIDALLENFYPGNDILDDADDWSEWQDNDTINFGEIGADPTVEVNRTTYPIPIAGRTDTALAVSLDEFSSDSTLVKDAEQIELAYNKLQTVTAQHKDTIYTKFGDKALYNFGCTANIANTPMIDSTGADDGSGLKLITKTDIKNLAKAWDNKQYPKEGRVLVMSPDQFWGFVDSDETLKRQYELNAQQGVVTGVLLNYYGFQIRVRTGLPLYRKVSGVWTKQAFGASQTSNDKYAAVAYIKKKSIMKAMGSIKMYDSIDNPDYQGSYINFRLRALATAKRQKQLGGIVQIAAS